MKLNTHIVKKTSFGGGALYKNKALLKTLKYVSDKSGLVVAGTTLACSAIVRPAMILLTPSAKKEDKQFACAKSIASGVLSTGLTLSIYKPTAKILDKITKSPKDYLTKETITNLKQSANTLDQSSSFNFVKQLLKLSPTFLTIIPKALITTALIVPVSRFLFNKDKQDSAPEKKEIHKFSSPTFTGANTRLNKAIIGVFENKKIQKAAVKLKDTSFIHHALTLRDICATACFAVMTALNPKMKKDNKKTLIYNTAIASGLTLTGGYAIDKAIEKPMNKLIKNFTKANANDPNLHKYLEGIKVLKPLLILSSVYYVVIPMLSTFGAEKLSRKSPENKEKVKDA